MNSSKLALITTGKLIPDWKIDEHSLTGFSPLSPVIVDTKATTIELIPMGAIRLRISALPVVT